MLTSDSSFAQILLQINSLTDLVSTQNDEIAELKTSNDSLRKMIEEQTQKASDSIEKIKSQAIDQNEKIEEKFNKIEAERSVLRTDLDDIRLRLSNESGRFTKNYEDQNEAIQNLVDQVEQNLLQTKSDLERMSGDLTVLVKQEEINGIEQDLKSQVNKVTETLSTETKAINRKFGIFQKQEKYLLDMLTNVQTEMCGLSDGFNSMEYRKTVSGLENRLLVVERKTKQALVILEGAGGDLGTEINEAFSVNKDLQYLEIHLTGKEYTWNVPVDLPSHTFLKIMAPQRRDGYISMKRRRDGAEAAAAEDIQRCPVRIQMTQTRNVSDNDVSHIHYRLRLNSFCKFIMDGVSVEEKMPDIDGAIFIHGIFLLSGSYSTCYLLNSRISFTTDIFINGTGCGEKHIVLGHTRFLRARENSFHDQSVVGMDRGKAGYLGRRLLVSGTDVLCEMGIRQTTEDDNIEYLC